MDAMTDAQLAAGVIAVVYLIRQYAPKVDGFWVPVAAAIVSALFVEAYAPAPVVELLRHSIKVAASAIGVMTGVGYGATKAGEALAKVGSK